MFIMCVLCVYGSGSVLGVVFSSYGIPFRILGKVKHEGFESSDHQTFYSPKKKRDLKCTYSSKSGGDVKSESINQNKFVQF